jgi:2-dehydropantoate 2-reductase
LPATTFVLIGSGALGRAFATVLAAAGHVVVLIGRRAAPPDQHDPGGLRVQGALESSAPLRTGRPEPGTVTIGALGDEFPRGATVLFTTKAHQLAGAARAVAQSWPTAGDPAAWTAGLQNGLLAGELLAGTFGTQRVAGACTVLGARRTDRGAVVASLGRTYFGELGGGRADRTDAAARAFNDAGLPSEATADIGSVLWAKMCNAVGVFGVSALTGLPTSQIMSTGPLIRAYRALIEEAALVASAAGVTITDHPDLPIRSYLDETPDAMVHRLTARPRPQGSGPLGDFSSMAQDLASGRPTEHEQIFGDLLRRARELGVQIPRVALVHDVVAGLDTAGRPAQLGAPSWC